MTASREGKQAIDGRTLGARGLRTRADLLAATERLLSQHGIRELRVVDIAREVGVSAATFYQYFSDVDAAVLSLTEAIGERFNPALGTEEWQGPDDYLAIRELVSSYVEFWTEHRAVLRTRNLAAQEGDERFREARHRALRPLLSGLQRQIERAIDAGRIAPGIEAAPAAVALVSMLERIAAFSPDLEGKGMTREALVETVATIVFQVAVGGPKE